MKLNYLLMVFCTMLYSFHTCLLRQFKVIFPDNLSSDLLVCYQYIISIVILSPFILRQASAVKSVLTRDNLPYLFIRCAMIFISTLSWFYVLSQVSAVNCIAISCMTPIFILLLAKLSLKELLPKEVLFLAIVAFSGAIVIISPDPSGFNFASLFAIFTAFLWAFNSTFTKKYLSSNASAMSIFFVTAVILSLIALPYLLCKKHSISLSEILYLIVVTLVFDIANILLIFVFSKGKIILVAPFDFLRVIFTTIFSSLLLSDPISEKTIVGIMIILFANTLSSVYGKKATIVKSIEQLNHK